MYRISPEALLAILEDLDKGIVRNRIVVGDADAKWARVALQRMLDITNQHSASSKNLDSSDKKD
jgi:hypothetical protein